MCNCGKNKSGLTPNSMHLSRIHPGVDETGTIMVQSNPDCTTPYSGPFRKMTVFAVGYGTENEKLFVRAKRTEAIAYARSTTPNMTFDQVLAAQLCDQVAEELFAI